jgi:hypothetical protein
MVVWQVDLATSISITCPLDSLPARLCPAVAAPCPAGFSGADCSKFAGTCPAGYAKDPAVSAQNCYLCATGYTDVLGGRWGAVGSTGLPPRHVLLNVAGRFARQHSQPPHGPAREGSQLVTR